MFIYRVNRKLYSQNFCEISAVWWDTSVIPVTWESEIGEPGQTLARVLLKEQAWHGAACVWSQVLRIMFGGHPQES
jgi:hypothetical protein